MYYSKSTGGFYTIEIHGNNMPNDVVELSKEEHAFLMQAQSAGKIIQANEEGHPVAINPPPPTIEEMVIARVNGINVDCEQAIGVISAGYPASEVLSWPKQETEARAWRTPNSTAPTPLIDALALARGIDKGDLVDRIIEKADLFAAVSGQYIGHRQALEDQLDALLERHTNPGQGDEPVTPEEVEAIEW